MNNLIRWDPFREMSALQRIMGIGDVIDRAFDRSLFDPTETWLQPTSWEMSLDIAETDDEFVVKASLPGIDQNDLEITYSNNVLTIKGETKEEQDVKEKHYHLRERCYGSFQRSVSLPSTVNADKIEASYQSGVLTLNLPKAEESKSKRIPVSSGSVPKVIEGKARNSNSKK